LSHHSILGIRLEPASLDEILCRAEKESFSHLEFLDLLLGAEAGRPRTRRSARQPDDPNDGNWVKLGCLTNSCSER